MRLLLLLGLLYLGACSGPSGDESVQPRFVIARLGDRNVIEASGLARSSHQDNLLWTLNDGGSSPTLYAFSEDGKRQMAVDLRGAKNIDWEDLASFSLDGNNWLVVADVGDNAARRETVSLYFLEEPAAKETTEADIAFEMRLQYPDGPRDCESIAVDVLNERILLLSKRSIPAELYAAPLPKLSARPGLEPVIAEKLGTITSIPQPTDKDRLLALPGLDWYWQPTAMDISADGSKAVILTYRAVYLYTRSAAEPWIAALQREPLVFPVAGVPGAEAVAISRDGGSVFVTAEGQNPPLIRFDL
jgi:hypothetical protein